MLKLDSGGSPNSLKRILIPIEGHPPELKLCQLFLDLAKAKKHKLTFFHVETPEAKIGKIFNKLEENIKKKDVETLIKVVSGEDPAHEILEESRKQYDLIAMTSRIKAFKKELFGSVTNKVARNAKCNVMVFHNIDKLPKSLSKILVPIFLPNRIFIKLALEFLDTECCKNADMTFLHIHELPIHIPFGTEFIPDEEKIETRKVLSIIKDESKAARKTPWFKEIVTRNVRKTLIEYVEKFKPDLVFMPARKRPRAVVGLLGTDEYFLTSHLNVPVILFF